MTSSSLPNLADQSARDEPPVPELLRRVRGPGDVKALPAAELPALAQEIREHLVASVSRTGGHLGPNLGVVEMTIALHRVFDSPRDVLLWDTGHQAYVHKMLTGRAHAFGELRRPGGLSGYPSRHESEHDIIENSHASTALSYADGYAKAFELRGEDDRAVVAVVGDGALTGGMCWEALNNLAAADRRVVIVVNDNGRSYAPTVGGLARHLAALRLRPQWEGLLKQSVKDVLAPQVMFEDLGLKYVGPVDGHDIAAVERALQRAKTYGGPVVVHCVTQKGRGFAPAEQDVADCMHGVGAIDPVTGRARSTGAALPWTQVFADEIADVAAQRPDVVAITAAMSRPVGLAAMADRFPERVFDVGIAEQHAVTSAAGLASAGMHPVVCIYATFLNRAFDQVLMDVALHRLPVTIVLDRAGVTGDDGASHHGMWDLAVAGVVPGLRVAAPRDASQLRELLREAVADEAGPTMVRFPKAQTGQEIAAIGRIGCADVLRAHLDSTALVVTAGPVAEAAVQAADRLSAEGIAVTVVDPRWVLPVEAALVEMAAAYDVVVTVEDGVVDGGVGEALARELRKIAAPAQVVTLGLPKQFIAHGGRPQILATLGLDVNGIAAAVRQAVGADLAQPKRRASVR